MYIENFSTWVALAVNLAGLLVPSNVGERGVMVRIETGVDGTYNSATNSALSGAGGQVPTIKVRAAANAIEGELLPSMLRRTRKRPIGQDTVNVGPKSYGILTNNNFEIRSLEIRMDAYRNGKRGPRISLNDEMCLTSLVWSPRNTRPGYENRRGAISGDLMYLCGYSWYPSGKAYYGYDLRCGWLDGDNSVGQSVKGLFLNLDKFGKGYIGDYAEDYPEKSSFCSNGVQFYTGNLPARKRSIAADSNNTTNPAILTPKSAFRNKAFVSTRVSAIELCDHPTSRGPSMLNPNEGIFCDMTTKAKVPMCNGIRTEGCMDYSRLQKRDSTALNRNLVARNVPANDISFRSFQLEYFTLKDVNGTIIDDGSNI
ncbi:hypothetical protein BGZ72_004363 [Mortierella alpina]|nr:hypothetical protein BGZ72_004363 [Mortierella alpina]